MGDTAFAAGPPVNKGRFEAFSDGVFAFAITLLVLAFTVPMHGDVKWPTNAELTGELLKLWPNLIGVRSQLRRDRAHVAESSRLVSYWSRGSTGRPYS